MATELQVLAPTNGSDPPVDEREEIEDMCSRVLDAEAEIFCEKPAVTDIIVSNVFGKFLAPLCQECADEHKAFYRARKTNRRGRAFQFKRRR